MTEQEWREIMAGRMLNIVFLLVVITAMLIGIFLTPEHPTKAAEQQRVYLPMIQAPCPCACPPTTVVWPSTTTTSSTTTSSTVRLQPYIEWFGADPSRLKKSAPDVLVTIRGTGFVPNMVAYLPFLGYFPVTISSSTAGIFIVPEMAWSNFPTDGPPEQELYAMLFDPFGRSSDIMVFIVEL